MVAKSSPVALQSNSILFDAVDVGLFRKVVIPQCPQPMSGQCLTSAALSPTTTFFERKRHQPDVDPVALHICEVRQVVLGQLPHPVVEADPHGFGLATG